MLQQSKAQQGYLLLEVLVTVGILAVGLLGVAAMQVTSLKSGISAMQRGEAAILLSSMTEKMRANTRGVYNGDYNNLTIGTPQTTAITTALQRAQNDMDTWQQEINVVFSGSNAAKGTVECPTQFNCIVKIEWFDPRIESDLQTDLSTKQYQHIASVVF